jgi:hypothetical protein
MKRSIIFAAFFLCLFSCKKENGSNEPQPSKEDVEKAAAFSAEIAKHRYQPREYYSDHPIDYNDTDNVVLAETDLTKYLAPHIVDDKIAFIGGEKIAIEQGPLRSPEDNSGLIERNYKIYATVDGVVFEFVDHLYKPLKYYLVEFTEENFLVYTMWTDRKIKVYTRFKTVI